MKSQLLKKGIAFVLSIIMLLSLSVTAYAEESNTFITDSYKTIDEESLSDSELAELNAEYKTKEEAEAESALLEYDDIITPMAALPTTPAGAYTVGGNTPYFYGSYTLDAGQAGYVRITASQNYNASVYTTGSTDTYLEIYTDQALTNRIYYNDDGGHGLNARIYFWINSGETYYIKVRGYSASTTGNYTFVIHRGQTTSRSEKGDMFSTYNSSTYKEYNNCFTYALTYYVHPKTGNRFRFNGQNPGELSGNAIGPSDLANATIAKSSIEAAMTRDFNYIGNGADWDEITATEQPEQGYFKVALVLDPGDDYHWYRQNPNGSWTHKLAYTDAIADDASGYLIYQPETCDRDFRDDGAYNYSSFIAYYQLRIPAGASPSSTTVIEEEIVHPINYNLTIEDIKALSAGMPIDDAMTVLGQAHDYIGSGLIGSVYELVDGTKVIVYFTNGALDQIRIRHDDGSNDIIVD